MTRKNSAEKRNNGYNRYMGFMADYASIVIKDQKQAAQITAAQQAQFQDTFYGFTGIKEAVENLELCLTFISGRMPRRKGVNPERFLKYHIGCYLQEIYILSERMERYSRLIYKRRKKCNPGEVTTNRHDALVRWMRAAFQGVIATRGSHVHVTPFDDESLRLLGTLSLLAFDFGHKEYATPARDAYQEARYVWKKKVTDNKKSIEDVLDHFFDRIYDEVISSKQEFLDGFSATYKPRSKS
jgi:hypothetical protein